jgi:hypothetical protein
VFVNQYATYLAAAGIVGTADEVAWFAADVFLPCVSSPTNKEPYECYATAAVK